VQAGGGHSERTLRRMAGPMAEIDGAALRRYRFARQLSQAALAERAGMTAPQLSRLENGHKQRLNWEATRALAAALGTGTADLCDGPARHQRRQDSAGARPAAGPGRPRPAGKPPAAGREFRGVRGDGTEAWAVLARPGTGTPGLPCGYPGQVPEQVQVRDLPAGQWTPAGPSCS
jgi:transcriptional regulator with XRE-family HTH domain